LLRREGGHRFGVRNGLILRDLVALLHQQKDTSYS